MSALPPKADIQGTPSHPLLIQLISLSYIQRFSKGAHIRFAAAGTPRKAGLLDRAREIRLHVRGLKFFPEIFRPPIPRPVFKIPSVPNYCTYNDFGKEKGAGELTLTP